MGSRLLVINFLWRYIFRDMFNSLVDLFNKIDLIFSTDMGNRKF